MSRLLKSLILFIGVIVVGGVIYLFFSKTFMPHNVDNERSQEETIVNTEVFPIKIEYTEKLGSLSFSEDLTAEIILTNIADYEIYISEQKSPLGWNYAVVFEELEDSIITVQAWKDSVKFVDTKTLEPGGKITYNLDISPPEEFGRNKQVNYDVVFSYYLHSEPVILGNIEDVSKFDIVSIPVHFSYFLTE